MIVLYMTTHYYTIQYNNNICIYIAQYPANTACSTRL